MKTILEFLDVLFCWYLDRNGTAQSVLTPRGIRPAALRHGGSQSLISAFLLVNKTLLPIVVTVIWFIMLLVPKYLSTAILGPY